MSQLNQTFREDLDFIVRTLIGEKYITHTFIEEHLGALGWSSSQQFRTVVVELNSRYHPANLAFIDGDIRSALDRCGDGRYIFCYPHEYVLLIPDEEWQRNCRTLDELSAQYKGILGVGVGEAFPLHHQYRSYHSALRDSGMKPLDEEAQ